MPILILLFLIFGSDCYVFFTIARHWPAIARFALFLPSFLLLFAAYLTFRGQWGWTLTLMMALLLCFVFPKILFCAFSLLGRVLALVSSPAFFWANGAGMVVAVAFCLCGAYGMAFGWKNLVEKEVEINSAILPPAFDGYRIVQISDLHLGTFGKDTAHIHRLVEEINQTEPDLIVFTGDLVNFTYVEVLPFKKELSRLKAKDGVVSILGNHDYALYAMRHQNSAALVEKLIRTEREMGWRLLLDENFSIGRGPDSIWIAGVQNIGKKFSANKGNLQKAIDGIPDGAFTVLLSHDPTHWEEAIMGKTKIPLTLSGHTHAMQFKLFGWSPSSMIFNHWAGHYQHPAQNPYFQGSSNSQESQNFLKNPKSQEHLHSAQHLYVSPGTGGNLPFRFGAWPEITILTLTTNR